MTQFMISARADRQAEAFADLALQLHDSQTMTETADAVLRYALPAISSDHGGIALRSLDGDISIATVSDDVPAELYALQIHHGDGPLIAAIQHDVVLRIPDAPAETRWPAWSSRAAALHVGSVVHLPLDAGHGSLGALSLYRHGTHAFSDDDVSIAQILARHAAVAVSSALRRALISDTVDARNLVGQAMGILMERHNLTPDQALAVLHSDAETRGVAIEQMAEQLVGTRRRRRMTIS